jgi:lipid-A-disaccharide synthase
VVPEILQDEATPARLATAAEEILTQPARRAEMRTGLAGLRAALGSSGAAARAAAELVKELRG